LAEELIQLLLLELHHNVVEECVEEVGFTLTVDLVFPLAQPCLGIKEISVRTSEYSISRQNTWTNLSTNIELCTASHLLVVPWLGAGVDGGGGHSVWSLVLLCCRLNKYLGWFCGGVTWTNYWFIAPIRDINFCFHS